MKGGFRLVCAPDSAGRSALIGQYVSAPMHISKPWWDEGVLIVNAINSTAGLFAGDEIDAEIEVRPGGKMLVTSASASRAYKMPEGRATVRQSIRVADGGWLEMLPMHFIPHAGSNYFQETTVALEPGGQFLWFETFTPGRVASGEAWEFLQFESRFHLACGSRPVVREVYALTADSPSVQALRGQFPNACNATCYATGIDFSDEIIDAISGLHHADCWVGCTRLDAPAIALRMVAANHLPLTRALAAARALIYRAFGRPLPPLRR